MSDPEILGPRPAHLTWRISAGVIAVASVIAAIWLAFRALSYTDDSSTGADAYMDGDLIGLAAGAMLALGGGLGFATALWRGRTWAKVVLIVAVVIAVALLVLL